MRAEAYAYSRAVESRHWWYQARAAIVAGVIARFAPPGPLRILDVGCGTGGDFALLSRFGAVLGVDRHPSAVRACRDAGFAVLQQDAEHLAFAAASFDLVCCLDVLNGVADDRAAVAEAARVVRPGGLLLYTVGALPSLWGAADDLSLHRRRYRRGELLALVPPGCRVLHCSAFNTLLLPLAVLSRRLERLRTGAEPPGLAIPPAPLNAALRAVFAFERHLVPRVSLPIGVSLLLVLRRGGSGPSVGVSPPDARRGDRRQPGHGPVRNAPEADDPRPS